MQVSVSSDTVEVSLSDSTCISSSVVVPGDDVALWDVGVEPRDGGSA